MFNEIFLIPISIYERLMIGACQDDLIDPKKIKSLAYKDQAVYLNLSTGSTQHLKFTVSDPLSQKEMAEHFPQVRNDDSVELAQATYHDTIGVSRKLGPGSNDTLAGVMSRLRVVLAGSRVGIVFQGDLQDVPRTLASRAIAATIINSVGFETYSKLANGTLHRRVCVGKH